MKMKLIFQMLVLSSLLLVFSCAEEDSNFIPISENEVYASDTNLETLLKELKPETNERPSSVFEFEYANSQVIPTDFGFSPTTEDGVLFDLTPYSFYNRQEELYRGPVTVRLEYLNTPEAFIRNGLSTMNHDGALLDLDFAVRLIFEDDRGYRLGLGEAGMPIVLRSEGLFLSEDVYTLTDARNYPYDWDVHPDKEDMEFESFVKQINGRTVYEYKMTMYDNSWLAFGKKSLHESFKTFCIQPGEALDDPDKTMAFAVLSDSENQIVHFTKSEEASGFCTDSYPNNALVTVLACSMDNYVDFYYTDDLLRNIPGNNIEISQEVSGIEEIVRRLSAI